MRDAIARFDERVRAIGDPEQPEPPLALPAVCRYLFRRAVPALVPVAVAVVGQFLFTGRVSGALTAFGVGATMVGGVAGAAVALEKRVAAIATAVVAAGLLVAPPMAVTGGTDDLFAVHLGLFGVITLFVAAVCYAETAGLPRANPGGGSRTAER